MVVSCVCDGYRSTGWKKFFYVLCIKECASRSFSFFRNLVNTEFVTVNEISSSSILKIKEPLHFVM